MDRKEAEALLQVTHQTLQNWADVGKIRVTKNEFDRIIDYDDEDVYNRLKITPHLIIHKIIVSINNDIEDNTSSSLNLAKIKAEILDKLVKNKDNLYKQQTRNEETEDDVEDIISSL